MLVVTTTVRLERGRSVRYSSRSSISVLHGRLGSSLHHESLARVALDGELMLGTRGLCGIVSPSP